MPATQTVINASCLTYLPTMAAQSVSAVVFSPPYNLAKRYRSYDDNRPLADYLAEQNRVAAELARVLRPDGHLFLNVGWNSENPWRSVEVAQEYAEHLTLQNRITWVKSIAVNGLALPPDVRAVMHDRQVGHFASIRSRHFLIPVVEDVWHFSPSGRSPITPDAPGVGVPYVWADQPERFGHFRERHCRGNALHLPYKTTQSRADRDYHPAPFPVALVEHCLRLADLPPGAVVLDPFLGTGATLVAAKILGLSGMGIEVDAGYCEAARRRLDEQSEGRPMVVSLAETVSTSR
jgi:site-specific DNA-methyltransferase (adenine-specific)